MFGAGSLTFHEFAVNEPLPLATIQEAIMDFLRGREDVAVIGAQAVNAYVAEGRMTQDVDLVSSRASALAEEARGYLATRFRVAVGVREIGAGRAYRVFQVRKGGNRHLLGVRPVGAIPEVRTVAGVQVVAPATLAAVSPTRLRIGAIWRCCYWPFPT